MAWSRALLIILVLLNLLAFAGLEGWLGSAAPRGEPERLTNQLNPERIKLRSIAAQKSVAAAKPKSAVVAEVAPLAPTENGSKDGNQDCVALVSVQPESARALEEDLKARPGLTLTETPTEAPTSWWVNLPPAASRAEADTRVGELHQQGVTDLFIVQEPGANQFAISLALFKQESQAQRFLDQLIAKGVQGARITPRGGGVPRFEVRGSAQRLADLSSDWLGRYPGARRQPCAP